MPTSWETLSETLGGLFREPYANEMQVLVPSNSVVYSTTDYSGIVEYVGITPVTLGVQLNYEDLFANDSRWAYGIRSADEIRFSKLKLRRKVCQSNTLKSLPET